MASERRRYVILDRDGTITEERHYLADPAGVELVPGALEGLAHLKEMGLGLIVVTNQSGVGRGYFSEALLGQVHERLNELLGEGGVVLDGIFYCPHTPDQDCSCRKPRPGLVLQAASQLDFQPRESFVIGDKPCDILLGQAVGARTFLVTTGYGAETRANPEVKPDFVVDSLAEVSRIIQRVLSVEDRRPVDHG